ncbi:MAG: hypothetical protein NC252_08090 [Roseburia sp.]|nr:hypothetical protein [Roseburia sp.]MCM1421126.1 hypothetical protein [Bacteroides sp.]MCM1511103.1 hypothetical protein [Clostridium sp.]
MTSNPTGRQMTPQRVTKRSRLILWTTTVMLAVVTSVFSGCGSHPDKVVSMYDTPEEALKDYASYLSRIVSKDKADIRELGKLTDEWTTLDDTISAKFFSGYETGIPERSDSVYTSLRDSIIGELCRLAESRPRSLADYLVLVNAVSRLPADTLTAGLLTSVHHFYGSMDRTSTYGVGNKETISRYEQFLSDALDSELTTKADVFTFLRGEDMAFRSFLSHLPTLGNIPLIRVRDNTSRMMARIVELASEEKPLFTPSEMVVILTMRNNRRLLQNALQCVNDIRAGKVGRDERAFAYLWMLLQPWLSFDPLSFSLMSEAQMNTMRTLATETPGCLSKLGNPKFPIDTEELPALLIRTYISTL